MKSLFLKNILKVKKSDLVRRSVLDTDPAISFSLLSLALDSSRVCTLRKFVCWHQHGVKGKATRQRRFRSNKKSSESRKVHMKRVLIEGRRQRIPKSLSFEWYVHEGEQETNEQRWEVLKSPHRVLLEKNEMPKLGVVAQRMGFNKSTDARRVGVCPPQDTESRCMYI